MDFHAIPILHTHLVYFDMLVETDLENPKFPGASTLVEFCYWAHDSLQDSSY